MLGLSTLQLSLLAFALARFCNAIPAPNNPQSQTTCSPNTVTKTVSTSSSPTGNCFRYFASFEQLTVTEPATALNFIRFYDSVQYNSGLVEYISGSPGVQPNSPPNFAVWTSLAGTPHFTADYALSTIYAINLYSFYYGCAVQSEESLVGVPIACTFTLTAYDIHGNMVAAKTFTYTPLGTVNAPMMYGTFPATFQQNNAYTYVFSFNPASQAVTTVGLYDSLLYSVCGNGSIAGNS